LYAVWGKGSSSSVIPENSSAVAKAVISAPEGKKQINWKYRPHLVATATNLPKGYGVAWFEGKTKVSDSGDFTAKEGLTSTHTYTAKIVDENGNAVTSSQEKKVTIEVKDDFFTKIISFFSRLFSSDVVNI
ncbi:MAG: hypothetical protein IKY00_02775, partial [Clostridia bacterium]|nr:hypothetical protein [Clostridia bacterium]